MGDYKRLDLVIKGGTVVLSDEVRLLDIGLKDGKIAQLSERIDAAASGAGVLNASGLTIMAGMVDAHVHLNEPGLGHWEGFETGSAALAAGGCTSYMDMPLNGQPPTVTVAAMEQKLAAASHQSYVDYALWGGLVPGKLEHLEPLAAAGVIGYKAFMSYPGGSGEDIFREVDDYTLLEGMKRIARLGRVLALHAESEPIVSRLSERMQAEGKLAPADYIASRPVIAELEAINRALFYAEQTGCPLHFVHISSAEGVRLIEEAKRRGIDVTVETCPHYLLLTADAMETKGAAAKCSPPMRDARNLELMWRAVADGHIDMIGSDHSPSPSELKRGDHFFAAWGGIAGAQSSVELIVGEGHIKRGIPLPLISRLLSAGPARRFGLSETKGEIRIGADGDLVLLDLNKPYMLEESHLYQRHKHSPYIGETMRCKVAATLCRGAIVYEEGGGLAKAKAGQWVKHQAI